MTGPEKQVTRPGKAETMARTVIPWADWRTTLTPGSSWPKPGHYLRADPVENTLLLTIADQYRDASADARPRPHPGRPDPCSAGWTGTGAGAFVHTPGWPVVLTAMPETAAIALAAPLGRPAPSCWPASTASRARADAVRGPVAAVQRAAGGTAGCSSVSACSGWAS